MREHDYEQARAEAATAVKVGKGAAVDAEYLLGESLAALGRQGEALNAPEDFVRDSPDNPDKETARLIANLRAAALKAPAQMGTPTVSGNGHGPQSH